MSKLLLAFAFFLGLLCFSSGALAADEARTAATPSKPRSVSLTLDPTRPLVGMAVLGAEVRFPRAVLLPKQPAKDWSLGDGSKSCA